MLTEVEKNLDGNPSQSTQMVLDVFYCYTLGVVHFVEGRRVNVGGREGGCYHNMRVASHARGWLVSHVHVWSRIFS